MCVEPNSARHGLSISYESRLISKFQGKVPLEEQVHIQFRPPEALFFLDPESPQ